MPNLFTQATESPPPTSEKAPFFVASTMASAIAFEPLAKLSNSNTPAGPFQRMVLAGRIALRNAITESGPASMPSQPSGISITEHTCWLASLENLSPATQSVPSTRFTPFCLASSMMWRARSSLSFSTIESPILPPRAFANVKVMPPQRIRLSTLSMRFSMIPIFVDTFEPPMIAVKGRLMSLRILSTAFTSFSMR